MADTRVGNPYRWDQHRPRVITTPTLWDGGQAAYAPSQIVDWLASGHGVVVFGGRGMGKSVLTKWLETRCLDLPHVRVALVECSEAGKTVAEVLTKIGAALGIDGPVTEARHLVDEATEAIPGQAILLLDEVDVLVRYQEAGVSVARALLDQLEAVRRRSARLGILAAGGLALTRLTGPLGSAFVSRARRLFLQPMERSRIVELAAPFSADGRRLPDDVIEVIGALTAGVPALVTYALECLWPKVSPTRYDAVESLGRFPRTWPDFMRQITQSALGDDPRERSAANARSVLHAIRTADDHPMSGAALLDAMVETHPPLDQVLHTLRAAALIAWDGIIDEPLIDARPSGSPILDRIPPGPPPSAGGTTLAARLHGDLEYALRLVHHATPDFRARGGRIVEEKVFSAFIATVLIVRGWSTVLREAQQAAGFADIRAEHPRHRGEHALIEVKHWGRKHHGIHDQVAAYRIASTTAAATVMIGSGPNLRTGWGRTYAADCLSGIACSPDPPPDPAPTAWTDAAAPAGPGCTTIRHFLLLLASR